MKLIVRTTLLLGLVLFLADRPGKIVDIIKAPLLIVQGVSVNVELRNIHQQLALYHTANGDYLPEKSFTGFVRQKFNSRGKDPLLDCWQQPYRYRLIDGGFRVISSGPDRQLNTEDDLTLTWKE